MIHLLLAFIAGLASACAFAPLGLWPAMPVALAVLLRLIERAPSLRSALARGWWFGVGQFVLGLNWIATAFTYQSNMPASLGWVAVLLLALYLAVYPAMAAGLAWRHGRGDRARFVLIFGAAWIVTEWLRATLFTGFAWNPIGVALLPTGLSSLAPLVGTYGLSGIAALLAGALLLAVRRERVPAILLLFSIGIAALAARLGAGPAAPATDLPVRIVQPNIGQQDKWKEGFADRNFERLKRLSGVPSVAPRLLLWPEAAITEPLQNELADLGYRQRAARLRRQVGDVLGPGDLLLTGGVTWQSRDGEDVTGATNSVFAVTAGGNILARYDKAHLVPYGEYLPARPILSAIGLSRLAPGDIDFEPGPGPRTLDLPVVGKVGFQLCYEIIFSGHVVDRADRPRFLFNPSNDAWFGAWGPPQHLAQARLRAIEEGLPVLRATPTGISAVIDADGRLLHQLGWHREGVIEGKLPGARAPTPFARWGNFLPFLFAAVLIAIAIAVSRRSR